MEARLATVSTSFRVMRPTGESLPQHLKEFCADISTEWETCQEDIDQRTSTTTDVSNYVVNMYDYYVKEEKTGIQLIRMFSEDFAHWPVQTWNRGDIKIRQALRDHLEAHGFVSKRSYSSVSRQLHRLVFEYFNEDALAEDPLSAEEQSANASEESFDTSVHSSADDTFDDNQADALDEDTANFDNKNSAILMKTTTPTSLTTLKKEKSLPRTPMTTAPPALFRLKLAIKKRESLPEGFAYAKERSAGLILVERNKEEKEVFARGIGSSETCKREGYGAMDDAVVQFLQGLGQLSSAGCKIRTLKSNLTRGGLAKPWGV
ncbi:hypothetical protein E4U58_001342 [Claviceps cyperi]|nr:hypothetical protein E4U58_001342 [Claviceps cyperi]